MIQVRQALQGHTTQSLPVRVSHETGGSCWERTSPSVGIAKLGKYKPAAKINVLATSQRQSPSKGKPSAGSPYWLVGAPEASCLITCCQVTNCSKRTGPQQLPEFWPALLGRWLSSVSYGIAGARMSKVASSTKESVWRMGGRGLAKPLSRFLHSYVFLIKCFTVLQLLPLTPSLCEGGQIPSHVGQIPRDQNPNCPISQGLFWS